MRIGIDYGHRHLEVEVREEDLVGVHQSAPAPSVEDISAAVRAALEAPLGFPALRRALTPDDHVAIVVDEHLPHLGQFITPVLEHITQAGVRPEAVTLLCAPPALSQSWIDELPDEYQDVRVEVHDPGERRKLSYLATTGRGRRIYLNRTAVDADQLVVVSRRGYDPVLGYSGSEGALYPALSDEATRQELAGQVSLAAPDERSWPVHKEAHEVAWLLGAPFMVQVIEGRGEQVASVLAGLADTSEEGQRRLNARWRVEVDRPADMVVAGVGADPGRQTFADLAQALAAAVRVVRAGGRIVLLSGACPALGPGALLLRQAEDPASALRLLDDKKPIDLAAAFQWAHAAQHANICVLSGLPAETVEELFAVPLDDPAQIQRLLDAEGSCVILPEANKILALVSRAQAVVATAHATE
jgi:nickel-dependent lactate racemase